MTIMKVVRTIFNVATILLVISLTILNFPYSTAYGAPDATVTVTTTVTYPSFVPVWLTTTAWYVQSTTVTQTEISRIIMTTPVTRTETCTDIQTATVTVYSGGGWFWWGVPATLTRTVTAWRTMTRTTTFSDNGTTTTTTQTISQGTVGTQTVTKTVTSTISLNTPLIIIHDDFHMPSQLWKSFGAAGVGNGSCFIRDGFMSSTVQFYMPVSLEMTLSFSGGKGAWGFSEGPMGFAKNYIVFQRDETGLYMVSSRDGNVDSFRIMPDLSGSHRYQIQWTSPRDITFYIDGNKVGRQTEYVPYKQLYIFVYYEKGFLSMTKLTCLNS